MSKALDVCTRRFFGVAAACWSSNSLFSEVCTGRSRNLLPVPGSRVSLLPVGPTYVPGTSTGINLCSPLRD
jgi:hypothetical protein